jgi:hypothetical protein
MKSLICASTYSPEMTSGSPSAPSHVTVVTSPPSAPKVPFDHGSQLDHIEVVRGAAPAQRAAKRGPEAYGAPVINVYGDHAQVAFSNESVSQQSHVVSSTYTNLAEALQEVLGKLDALDPQSRPLVVESAKEVLGEIVKPEPDATVVQRGLAQLRGILAPLALATASGAGKELSEWALDLIGKLVS